MKVVRVENKDRQDEANHLRIRAEDIAQVKESMERGLEKRFKYFGWNTEEGILRNDAVYCISSKEAAEDFCWNPDIDSLPNRAVRLLQVYNALEAELRQLASGSESPAVISISLQGIEKVNPLDSKRQYNYLDLKKTLQAVGPWDSVKGLLVEGMLTNSSEFQAPLYAKVYGEPFELRLHFMQNQAGYYMFDRFHIAGININHQEIGGHHSALVEEKLRTVDLSTDNFNLNNLQKRHVALGMMDTLKRYPEGKEMAEKLYLKYSPEMLGLSRAETEAKIAAARTARTFPVKPDFIITTEQACNLLSGRPVYHTLPGKDVTGSAWFKLDPLHKDSTGNSLLLQYHAHYNFHLPYILSEFPLANRRGMELDQLVQALHNGHQARATMKLQGKLTEVRLEADPLHRTVAVYTATRQPFAPGLMEAFSPRGEQLNPAPPYPFLYAYDSHMNRRPYFPGLAEQASPDVDRKEAIMRSLNTPDSPAPGQGRKI